MVSRDDTLYEVMKLALERFRGCSLFDGIFRGVLRGLIEVFGVLRKIQKKS